MPLSFSFRCKCCGLPQAAASQCDSCEAPQAMHEEVYEPSLYGEPLAIIVEALILVIRDAIGQAQDLVSTWRTGGSGSLVASHFHGLAQITGTALLISDTCPTALDAANMAAAAWLCDGVSKHVPEHYSLLYERYFVESCYDDPEALSYLGLLEQCGLKAHNRELSRKPSEASAQRHLQFAQRDLVLLDALEERSGGVPEAERASVGVLRWNLQCEIEGARFVHHACAAVALEPRRAVHAADHFPHNHALYLTWPRPRSKATEREWAHRGRRHRANGWRARDPADVDD
jgi:hypothetical protein